MQIKPLVQQEEQEVLNKWTPDTEGDSAISHTELDFAGVLVHGMYMAGTS